MHLFNLCTVRPFIKLKENKNPCLSSLPGSPSIFNTEMRVSKSSDTADPANLLIKKSHKLQQVLQTHAFPNVSETST